METTTAVGRPSRRRLRRSATGRIENLSFIRRTMEASGTFTAVSGAGRHGHGHAGARGRGLREPIPLRRCWACAFGREPRSCQSAVSEAMRSCERHGAGKESALSGPGRKFMLNFMPSVAAAGAALTAALRRGRPARRLLAGHVAPPVWNRRRDRRRLLRTHRARHGPRVHGARYTLGLAIPETWGQTLMAIGFGGLHLAFGAIIAWRYGG